MTTEKDRKRPSIECTENGPYLVKELENLTNSRGDEIPTKTVTALCRCGSSDNKPFCDGTHAKFGFFSETLSDGESNHRENYVGKEIVIHDNRGICSHAGVCTSGLPSVWRTGVEPWIDADGDDPAKITNIIEKCPSGALSYSVAGFEHRGQDREPAIQVSKDGPFSVHGMTTEKDRKRPSIECTENGPYLVKELENLTNSRGDEIPTKTVTALCRCGSSDNKPFCDGTHAKFGFFSETLSDGESNHRENYVGKEIVIHDNRGICSHAGVCTSGLPSVWRTGVEPWIDADGDDPAKITNIIEKCPAAGKFAAVYAVRQGPFITHNIRALIVGRPLRIYRPQDNFLTLLNLGDGKALGTKWGRSVEGRWVMKLKDWIDRRFMRRFQEPL